MTRLTLLDGPATAAVRDQLMAVYRAAMGAPPFHEAEVETGWFAGAGRRGHRGRLPLLGGLRRRRPAAGFAYGLPTPEIPADGWYGSLREAVGSDATEQWLTGQFAVVWIAVHPDRRGRGIGRGLLERLLAGAGSDRAWLVTHDLAPSTAPSASASWATAPSAGTTPTGSSSAPSCRRTSSSGGSRRSRLLLGRRRRTW